MASFGLDGEIEQRYKVLRHIGSGAYGVVWCALDRHTGKQVALKKVFDAFGNQQDAQRTYREVMLLQNLSDNERIVGLVNVIRAVNDIDIYLVFELAETDLTVVLKKKILQPIHIKYLMYQTIKVVAQLHARRIIHRDLKPSNVFLNTDCSIKLGDFGLARTFNPAKEMDDPFTDFTEYIATRWYRSPEIIVRSSVYTTAMDMWAVGCMVGELLLGQPLFAGTSTINQLELIVSAVGQPSEKDVESLCANEAWQMLDELGDDVPMEPLSERLEGCDADAIDLIEKLIVFNPTRRLTALQALEHPFIKEFVTADDLASIAAQPPLALPLPDEDHFTAQQYKEALYEAIRTVYRPRQHA